MKNNRFLQIAALALCLITVSYSSISLFAYEKIAPWVAYEYWRVDHNGGGGSLMGTWYRYSHNPPNDRNGEWGQFTCLSGGNQCVSGAHATGWNLLNGQWWMPEGSFEFGPFQGERIYNSDCNCYI